MSDECGGCRYYCTKELTYVTVEPIFTLKAGGVCVYFNSTKPPVALLIAYVLFHALGGSKLVNFRFTPKTDIRRRG